MDNELRMLCVRCKSRGIERAEIVEFIRRYHPKFDKTMLSRCEQSDVYGEQISREVMDALYAKFAPEMLPQVKWRRQGRHKLPKSIYCRLSDSDHERLLAHIELDGDFETVQDWMTAQVREYINS